MFCMGEAGCTWLQQQSSDSEALTTPSWAGPSLPLCLQTPMAAAMLAGTGKHENSLGFAGKGLAEQGAEYGRGGEQRGWGKPAIGFTGE